MPQAGGWSVRAIAGIVLSVIGIILIPILFAGLGIVLGYLEYSSGDKARGKLVMMIGAACLVVGTIMGGIAAVL
jgi:hypothetical protein